MSRVPRETLSPVPWRDFVVFYQVATAALQQTAGDTAARSDPFATVVRAAEAHFGDDGERAKSFLYRFWALMDLVAKGQLTSWVTTENETQRLHPVLLLAAAEVRMTKKARFPTKRFVQYVEEVIRTESDETT